MDGNTLDVTMPLVSVCCTTYNLENYISKTIDSILSQETDFDYELIIHDDASTDDTPSILESYSDKFPGLTIIYQEENLYNNREGGLGYIFRNHILPKARGKYIAVCDGDDYWVDSLKLQKQVNFLEEMQEYSACFTNAVIQNEITNEKRMFYEDIGGGIFPDWKIILDAGSSYPTSTLLFKKEKFTESNYFNQFDKFAIYYRYDTLLIYGLLFNGQIGYLDDCTAIYRRWEGGLFSSIMHNSDKVSKIKENEIYGNIKILRLIDRKRKKLFKRKISIDSLYVIRNKRSLARFKYLLNLNIKEVYKYIFNI